MCSVLGQLFLGSAHDMNTIQLQTISVVDVVPMYNINYKYK